jgi:hypothetical protein
VSTEPQPAAQRFPLVAVAAIALLVAVIAAVYTYSVLTPPAPRPILSGTAESGMFWKSPLTAASNEGFLVKGYRVEVYETFVVATDPATGAKHVRPHGFYSELVVK